MITLGALRPWTAVRLSAHSVVGTIALAALLVLSAACAQPSAKDVTAPVSCGPAPTSQVSLSGAAASSPTDVWVVGSYQNNGPAGPLTEHYDGRAWAIVAAPSGPWTASAYFDGVAVARPGDVWAVGAGQGVGESQTLIEHWEGARWAITPSPNESRRTNELSAVDALSRSDVWAVGDYVTSDRDLVLTEHWDGSSWKAIPASDPARALNRLSSVSGVSPDDVWAVGFQRESDAAAPKGLVEHWDGTAWTAVPILSPGTTATLTAVRALSATDVWVAGEYADGGTFRPLVEHWDGTQWSQVGSPAGPNPMIQALGWADHTGIWLGGSTSQGHGDEWLLEYWNGASWSETSPAPRSTGVVNSILLTGAEVWAVGTHRINPCGPDWGLIERWRGTGWTQFPSPHDGPGH